MSIQELKLGQSVDNLLKTANANFTEIGNTLNDWSDTIEAGGTKGIVFSTVAKMIECLNNNQTEDGAELKLNIGDEIYIVEETAPDFWVVGKVDNLSTGSAPNSWAENTTYTFGYYQIRTSKSKEINLENYITQDEFEEGLQEAGKVQDVYVNNSSVVIDKIAYINIDEIQTEKIAVDPSSWVTASLNGNSYWAIIVAHTDTAFEMLNNDLEAVVIQRIEYNGYLHLCVSEQPTTTWYIRKIKGNAVTTGGSSGSGTKKYLHKLNIVTYDAVVRTTTISSEEGLYLENSFLLVDPSVFFIISTNQTAITSLDDENSILFVMGGVKCVEQEIEDLGEGSSSVLSKNEYYLSIQSAIITPALSLTVIARGAKVIMSEENVSNKLISFSVDFPTYTILADTVTEL